MYNKILIVDDDATLLSSYQRSLGKEFNIETAQSGKEGLESIAKKGPFSVIISDLRMPIMDGLKFLEEAKKVAPKSIRMMLTGYADLEASVDAINRGNIFRLLIKPCSAVELISVVNSGIEQYRLIMAEKELLEKTLSGCIKILSDILSLISPKSFSHATRVRRLVQTIARELKIEQTWQLEIAAMLSQLGCVTIPDDIMNKVFDGKPLNTVELKMYNGYSKIGGDLLSNIPRFEHINTIITNQEQHYDGSSGEGAKGDEIPLESRILKVSLDHDLLVMSGLDSGTALVEIHKRSGRYDPVVVNALERLISIEDNYDIKKVAIGELSNNMILAEDIHDDNNVLLVSKGQEVTSSMIIKLKNYQNNIKKNRDIKVIIVK